MEGLAAGGMCGCCSSYGLCKCPFVAYGVPGQGHAIRRDGFMKTDCVGRHIAEGLPCGGVGG